MILKKIEFEIASKEISQAVSGRFDNDYSKRPVILFFFFLLKEWITGCLPF